jgi:hypothetical protein
MPASCTFVLTRAASRTAAAVVLALCGALAAIAHAQPLVDGAPPPIRIQAKAFAPYVLRTWTARDGLPDEQVNAIVQARDGYLWLATYAGLVRFDGLTFETFTAGNSPGFLSDRTQVQRSGRSSAMAPAGSGQARTAAG